MNARLARHMLESLKIWPLLNGYRGRPPADVNGLIEALMVKLAIPPGARFKRVSILPNPLPAWQTEPGDATQFQVGLSRMAGKASIT